MDNVKNWTLRLLLTGTPARTAAVKTGTGTTQNSYSGDRTGGVGRRADRQFRRDAFFSTTPVHPSLLTFCFFLMEQTREHEGRGGQRGERKKHEHLSTWVTGVEVRFRRTELN